jgi:hypothetical protein
MRLSLTPLSDAQKLTMIAVGSLWATISGVCMVM